MKPKRKFSYWLNLCVRIVLGSVIYAVGFQFFTYPNAIISGGVTGISMIINFLFGLPVGVMIIALNIPLFAVSWKKLGLEFMLISFAAMVLSSVLLDVFSLIDFAFTKQPLLAAVYGGIIKGFGMGLVYSTGATGGGIDIVAKLLRHKYQYLNFSTLILILDAVILAAFAVIFSRYDSAMYAVIAMFVFTKIVDLVLFGTANSKVCYIITDRSGEIKDAIIRELGRGVTLLRGQGGYSHKDKQVILCVIKRAQIVELKHILRGLDEGAFLIVSDSNEVFGKGFASIYDN